MARLSGNPRARRLTAAFLTALEAQGIAVGVGHHQSVQELLDRLPADTPDATLGDCLTAVFATSASEQQLGRELYARAVAVVNATNAPANAPENEALEIEEKRDLRQLLLRLGGLGLLITTLTIAYLLRPPTVFELARTVSVKTSSRTTLAGLDSLPEIGAVASYAWATAPLDTMGGPLTYRAGKDTLTDRFDLRLVGTKRREARVKMTVIVQQDTARAQVPKVEKEAAKPTPTQRADYMPLPLPYPKDVRQLAPVEAKNDTYARLLHYGWWPLVVLVTALLLWGFYLLLRYLRRRKARLVARKEATDGAPHFWRVELPEIRTAIDWGAGYPALLRQLRRRREDDFRELDLNRTIRGTIASGGLPHFHYRSATRPAEYLLLIDRGGVGNHHARLFEQLYQQLTAEEVLIERYFYDGDPRLLYQTDRAQPTPLSQLQRRLPNARLLLVGSGDRLLHPATGKLAKWVEPLFGTWTSRSVLTTLAPSDWGRDERRIAAFFSLLPASMQSLRLLVERLNDGQSEEQNIDFRSLVTEAELPPVLLEGSLIGSLERSFSLPLLQWIAACALYPALHWDLTLFFGDFLARRPNEAKRGSASESNGEGLDSVAADTADTDGPQPTDSLLSSQNLLALSRLPWFVNGSIPAAARRELTDWLRLGFPDLYRDLRKALATALERAAPPPAASVAKRELDFFRLQNEWILAAPKSKRRAELSEQLAQRIASGDEPDVTVARLLEDPPADAIVLPRSWNDRLYPEGLPGLGLQPEVRRLAWGALLLPLMALIGYFTWPALPPTQHCEAPRYLLRINPNEPGDTVLTIQLCDKADSLILADYLWVQRIAQATSISNLDAITALNRTTPLQSVTNDSVQLRIDAYAVADFTALTPQDSLEKEHRANVGAMLWNRGLELLDTVAAANLNACGVFTAATDLVKVDQPRGMVMREHCFSKPDNVRQNLALQQMVRELEGLNQRLAVLEKKRNRREVAALRSRINTALRSHYGGRAEPAALLKQLTGLVDEARRLVREPVRQEPEPEPTEVEAVDDAVVTRPQQTDSVAVREQDSTGEVAQTKLPCDRLVLDVAAGTLNGLGPDAEISAIRAEMPCYTSSDDGPTEFNYGGGTFYRDDDFYFYTELNVLDVREGFTGELSLDILGKPAVEAYDMLGNPLSERIFSVKSNYEEILSGFDRVFNTANGLVFIKVDGEEKVSSLLFTGFNSIVIYVLPPDSETSLNQKSETWVVSVGISLYQRLRENTFAFSAAQNFAFFCRDGVEKKADPGKVNFVGGERATRDNILSAIRAAFEQSGPGDDVILFFAGQGSAFAFFAVDYDGFSEGVTFDELARLFGAFPGRNVVILLDIVPQNVEAAGSAYGFEKTPQIGIITSGRKSAQTPSKSGPSIFTQALQAGLSGAADLNDDGRISFNELSRYIQRNASSNGMVPRVYDRLDRNFYFSVPPE